MIKLIATDLDGTLFRNDKTFSDEFYIIYKKLMEKDIKFVIASGNQYELIRERFSPIKDELIYVCENGNKIVYQNKIIYLNVLSNDNKKIILNLLNSINHLMIVYCGKKHSYILNKFKYAEDFIRLFNRNYRFVNSFDEIDDDIMKFSIADINNHEPEKYVNLIKKHLPSNIQAITTGNEWFDIFDSNINKGTSIKFLQKYFSIDKKECMAFGDMMNDYELLLNVEESYAMANGLDELKAIAKHIAKSNEEDGVIEVLRNLV